jgi:hypothetical protein
LSSGFSLSLNINTGRMADEYEETSYTSVKTGLNSILKARYKNLVLDTLDFAAQRMHAIEIHVLHFIKLYILHVYHDNNAIPNINFELITDVVKVICPRVIQRGKPPSQATQNRMMPLEVFFQQHYRVLIPPEDTNLLHFTNLTTPINYMAKRIVTMFKNNIITNHSIYVDKFVDVILRKKETVR